MKVCVQRVKNTKLEIDGKQIASFDKGMVGFVGFTTGDNEEKIDYIVNKICGLRIFEDENEKMNLSVKDIDGSILIIPNFTIYADCSHGFRPSFQNALAPYDSKPLFEKFVNKMKQQYPKVYNGIFGSDMQITQQNDGPITVIIEK